MIIANRFRHSTEQERRLGHGPMRARAIQYRIEKADLLERLRDAQEMEKDCDGYVEVKDTDIAAVEAGRPVAEHLIKALYGSDLDSYFVKASPDHIADAGDLIKAQRETDDVYENVVVVVERYTPREERPLPGSGPIVTSEVQCFLPSVADLRDRLRKAMESGAPFVRDTDANLLDRGRVREVVLKSLYPEVPLEEIAEGEDLADALAGRRAGEPLQKSVRKSAVRPEAVAPVKKAYTTYARDLQAAGRMDSARQAARELDELDELIKRGAGGRR